MGTLTSLAGKAARAFGYHAVEDKKHRRPVSGIVQSEDAELPTEKRRKLIASTRDVRRNFEVAAWAVRRHLDFVSTFSFSSEVGVPSWDNAVEAYVAERSKRENFDAAGRHPLRRGLRLMESLRAVDGDLGFLKVNGGRAQIIEGDRLRNPSGRNDADRWCHGVKIGDEGAALAYSIHRRKGSSFEEERIVPASRLYLHGYFDRYDQVRGISPLAAALNRFRDTYDNLDYALAKAKVLQLFGLAVFRKPRPEEEDEDDQDGDGEADTPVALDPDKGPFTFEGVTGEDAKFLQADQPGPSFLDFTSVCILIALKSLDIPYFFFDESRLNFFGGKAALTLYEIACREKRADNVELLDWWTRWQVGLAVANGDLDPLAHGLTFEQVFGQWRWIARGIPWWDKGREIEGDIRSVHMGFEDYASIVEKRTGEKFTVVIDRIAEQQAYMKAKGVAVLGPQSPLVVDFSKLTQPKDEADDESED